MYILTNDDDVRQFIVEQCLFTQEAARLLHISPQRLNQLVQAGKLQPIKKGQRNFLFLRSDVEKRKGALPSSTREGGTTVSQARPDLETMTQALNYFTMLAVHQWAPKKGQQAFEKAQIHWPLNIAWIDYVNEMQSALDIDGAEWQKMYDEVRRGFELLPADTYIVRRGQQLYPPLLNGVDEAPEFLFMQGNVLLAQQPIIAVVGTRQPSEEGIHKAHALAELLGKYHIVVASGLARGIDFAAHTAALESQTPTIAVLGTPLTTTYPKEHRQLQTTIAERGLLISQFHPSAPVFRWNFPKRNAVMSGISLATVVVEAGETSGALIQADHALKQGRLVFVPQSAVDNSTLQWPRRYVNEKGAKSFRRIDELIRALTHARIIQSSHRVTDKEESMVYVSRSQ